MGSSGGLSWPLSVPVLSDGVVTLRAHTPTDIDDMLEMCRDPEALRWTSIPLDSTRESVEHYAFTVVAGGWDDGNHFGWAIEVDGRFAGNVDVRGDGPIADIGFVLHPWARGRGLMVRAVRLATDWAFVDGGVEIVHWRANVGNVGSLRVAHAAGFNLHGVTPGAVQQRELVVDAWTASRRFGDPPVPRGRWAESTVIDTDRLRLRPFVEADIPRIVETCSDETTRQWLGGMPHPYVEATARCLPRRLRVAGREGVQGHLGRRRPRDRRPARQRGRHGHARHQLHGRRDRLLDPPGRPGPRRHDRGRPRGRGARLRPVRPRPRAARALRGGRQPSEQRGGRRRRVPALRHPDSRRAARRRDVRRPATATSCCGPATSRSTRGCAGATTRRSPRAS